MSSKLNIIDILLLCYVSIGVINLCFIHPDGVNRFMIVQWIAFCLCYIALRRTSRKQWMLWGLILVGVIESVWAILQKMHWLDSRHSMFDMTGTFGNPGQLGGFLAVTVTATWGLYQLYQSQHFIKKILLGLLLLLTIILILSDSRAGWIAALVGCVYIWCIGEKKRIFPQYVRIIISVLVVFLFAGGYYYKKDSVNGRLLIWRVSADMIADAPLTGHGVGAFESKYMFYQARYLGANPYSEFGILADNVIYPYNELLHIGVELGIPGMLAAVLLIAAVFRYVSPRKENTVYAGAFIALFLFSMFSYPSHVFLLSLLLPVLLGGMVYEKGVILPRWFTHQYTWWLIGIIGLCLLGKGWYEYAAMETRIKNLYSNSPSSVQASERYMKEHLCKLKSIPRFLDLYAQYSYRHLPVAESFPVLKQTASIVPTSEIFCDLGDIYLQQNQIEKAIECYQLSSNMIPCRITPRYKLFQLYRTIGDSLRMQEVGKKLLVVPVKIENTQTLRIKAVVKKLLQ